MILQQVIDGFDVTPKSGNTVQGDDWPWDRPLTLPEAGERDLFGQDVFRIKTPRGHSLLVRVKVTGRKVRYLSSMGGRWVRVRICSVGDGEPDTEFGGMMEIIQ